MAIEGMPTAGALPAAGVVLLHGDNLDLLERLPADSIDAVVTDPPYGLAFMGKEFDKLGDGPGQQAFHLRWARAVLRVLKPGGHLIAFGGTRTYHRLASGLEDAGFEMRDCLFWAYGSGFPKSLDVGKAIDKIDRLGPMRERALAFTAWMRGTGITAAKVNAVTGTCMGSHYLTDGTQPLVPTPELFDLLRPHLPAVPAEIEALVASRTVEIENMKRRAVVGSRVVPSGHAFAGEQYGGSKDVEAPITLPHTEAAQAWHGWGTALKPAVEPAVLARKPLIGTVAANVLTFGTGALNVDGCRIPMQGEETNPSIARYASTQQRGNNGWDHVNRGARFDDAAAESAAKGRWPANLIHDGSPEVVGLFPETAASKSGGKAGWQDQYVGGTYKPIQRTGYDEAPGSAARFFYCAKAAPSERPDVMVCGCLAGVLPMRRDGPEAERPCPTCGKPAKRLAHPTVKPVTLMEYLIKLITPPGGVVLDPFAGSGSTLVAAQNLGVRAVGMEREAEYVVIARSRLEPA